MRIIGNPLRHSGATALFAVEPGIQTFGGLPDSGFALRAPRNDVEH
jgi:hypothetical protein